MGRKPKSILKLKAFEASGKVDGKIPTAPYSNQAPGFSGKIYFDFSGSEEELFENIDRFQKRLYSISYKNFEAEAQKAKLQKIKQDKKDFRWYTLENGDQVPSVTSILSYDGNFHVSPDQLKVLAAQGTIIHRQVEIFIETKEWKEPKDIEGLTAEIYLCRTAGLSLDGWDFPAFVEKYKPEQLTNGLILVNPEYKYGGTSDGECLFDELPTIFDIKRTPDKVKNFMQMAAYARCPGMDHIQQMMIIPINDKTDQGFSKPIISTDIDKYWELFLAKRKEFEKVYDI